MRTETHAATAHAAKYMTQLSKHWSHKYPVQFDEARSRIELSAAVLEMAADAEGLDLVIEAADEAVVARLEGVVAEHLGRFSFREPELAPGLKWVRA